MIFESVHGERQITIRLNARDPTLLTSYDDIPVFTGGKRTRVPLRTLYQVSEVL